MEFKLIFVLFILGLANGFEFVIEPKSTTAMQGEAVMLACSVTGADRGTIYWQRVHTGRYISLDYIIDPYDNFGEDMKNRYRIIGEPSAGEYTLLINDVKKSDIGRYACLYSEPSGAKVISRHATLSVLIPPSNDFPRCRVEPEGAVIGDTVDLVCESAGGLPPATLTWFRGNEILTGDYGKSGELTQNRYRKVLEATDRGVEFICEATGIAIINTLRTCSLTALGLDISVQIKPQLKVADEGSRSTFTCIAPGDMRNYDVYWQIGEEELDIRDPRMSFRDGHPRLRIDPVTLSDHGRMITCIVYDFYGFRGNASSILFVTKTQTTKPPSKNAIFYEPEAEQPTRISLVASVEGGIGGVFTAPNELPAADQATGNAGSSNPSDSPQIVSKTMGAKETESPKSLSQTTASITNNNPSMIFTNHFAMPTIDTITNKTEEPAVERGDSPVDAVPQQPENMSPTKSEPSATTISPNDVVDTTGDVTDPTEAPEVNEVEVPEMQSEVNENENEAEESNDAETETTETPNEIDNNTINDKAKNSNLEGTDTDNVVGPVDSEKETVSGKMARLKIICGVLVFGVITIGFGFWRFSKSR
ncbi:uncharacterized protein LOC117102264 [Anneissia japonica]|uniref:uncharacterized protein LOC117102264 n=1 Tax=Anneissia japonica TaxID=1529436 RepID=UPI0014256B22|nr:uncharacterized protein LOC117102264 [Anneissia japonica]